MATKKTTTAKKPPAAARKTPARKPAAKPRRKPTPVLSAVNKAVKAAPWISDSDAGAVELARHLARALDDKPAASEHESRGSASLANALSSVLRDLKLTPKTTPGEDTASGGGRLAEIINL